MKIIDISLPVNKDLPLWPTSSGFSYKQLSKIGKGVFVNESHLNMNLHTGTHIDAPLHFVKNGSSIETAPLDVFFGPAVVVFIPGVTEISLAHLEKLGLPKGVKRILFKTDNSKVWPLKVKKFKKNYVGLTAEAATWLVKRGVKLVGIDYLSIATLKEAKEVHQVLLGKGAYILEGLNLSHVKPGEYTLACFPVKLTGAEASPTRAVLLKE